MNQNYWNIRGINSQDRWDDIANKISESKCNIICMQETKRETFDSNYLKILCPRRLNQFIYSHSVGNSGGLITIWNGSAFNGSVVSQSYFQITTKLSCTFSARTIYVTNVYVSCKI
jgi:exonuclease III